MYYEAFTAFKLHLNPMTVIWIRNKNFREMLYHHLWIELKTLSWPGLRRTARPCTRTVPFLVVPGRSWNEHDQKSNLERNDPEQGTTRFQKNGNEWNEVVPGTRSFLVVLRVRAQHRNGIFRVRTTLCQN